MPRIVYRTHAGDVYEVEAPVGTTVMEGAVRNSVPGIDGDCGGAAACGTCHVYVSEDWLGRLLPKAEMELNMLEFVEGERANSRLGCQIKVEAQLDGLVVDLPKSQH
ncbi:MAG: 2Fe-2S iron-sulfur cluster-binding protein [Rhizomicrobium sp.]